MLRNLNKSSAGRRILGSPFVGLIASQIISETATGDSGPGLLYDEALANTGKQLRLHITSSPSSGVLFVYENGALDLTGAADGSYSIGYQYYLDNVLAGSDTATVTVGPVNASAGGGTGTSTGSGTGGAATGTTSATASGGTGTGTGSGSGGAATGAAGGSASAAGGTGTGIGSGSGGSATAVTVDATAAGGTGTGSGSGSGGTPIGDDPHLAPGPESHHVRTLPRKWIVKQNRLLNGGKMSALPSKDPQEIKTVTFDFSADAETIASSEITAVAILGTDPDAQNVLMGGHSIAGALVMQRIQGGLDGTTYALRCVGNDADGEVHVLPVLLPVKTATPA